MSEADLNALQQDLEIAGVHCRVDEIFHVSLMCLILFAAQYARLMRPEPAARKDIHIGRTGRRAID